MINRNQLKSGHSGKGIGPLSIILIVVAISIFSSCRTTRYVTFNATQPAEITFNPSIEKFAIADRTKHKNKNLNVLEGVISGERPGDDRRGVQTLMVTFREAMRSSGRFDVSVSEDRLEGNPVMAELPEPMPWSTITRIANENEADLVILVEVFDSDFTVTSTKQAIERSIREGKLTGFEFIARGSGTLRVGFRMYDPLNQEVIDQETFNVNHHWESRAPTPIAAASDLIHRGEAMVVLSEMAGRRYASKLSPTTIRVRRQFYSRKRRAPELAIGSRYADVGEWDKSLETWMNGYEKATRRKIAGRYCHNIAVAYEVLGDLDKAIEWSNKAWVEYENKKSREYNRILRYRKQDEAILEDQQSNN